MKSVHQSFIPAPILSRLGSLTSAEADSLNFGVVKLDSNGNVLIYSRYNATEFTDFGGKSVIGKNYFSEVAPCSNNFLFSGRFLRGVEQGMLDNGFEYVFTYKIAPTKVMVHLYHDATSATNWIFVKKI